MRTAIHWFRNDLRLTDNRALASACADAERLALVHILSPEERAMTRWGFMRTSPQRRKFRDQALAGLAAQIERRGGQLLRARGRPGEVLPALARQIGADRVFCETIAAPEEHAELAALRAAGLEVHEVWQSSLLDPADLPFEIPQLPEVFTRFREAVERAGVRPRAAQPAPSALPTAITSVLQPPAEDPPEAPNEPILPTSASFPITQPEFDGAESAALAHVDRYFRSPAPALYKQTRNALAGVDFSTKFSPWLACGALSPRSIFDRLKAHEALRGPSDGSDWIRFELLWRDFFRFASMKHGARLFGASGLSARPPPHHDAGAFGRWCTGETGHDFVDAGQRELAATGYLSNRMRQVVASYLVHDLDCDWRAGAAWFESRLIDYDVYSNHGNWLYIAGRGADPRGGRRFCPDKQADRFDSEGAYRRYWRDLGPARL